MEAIQYRGGSLFGYLAELFEKKGVRGLLVGGYAINAYHIQRMTFDIDFMVTSEDFNKIKHDLFVSGYSVFQQTEAFVQLRSDEPGLRDIDFLLGDGATVDALAKQGKTIQIAGKNFMVPSALHLIAMKLHSLGSNERREFKDLPDIIQLFATNGIDPQSEENMHLFRKYNAGNYYEKVVEAVKKNTK